MTRALALRENQMRAILRAARKEGIRIEVKIGEVIVTTIPEDHAQDRMRIDDEEEIRL